MEKEVYCFGYSRKSPDDKLGTDTSIKNQNDLHKINCQNKGWNLVSIEEDKDISGSDENRKGFIKQIQNSINFKKDNPGFEVYFQVKDSKRFARNSSYAKKILDNLSLEDVKVFSIVKNGFIDYSDIGDRIMGVVDEQVIYDAKKYSEITFEIKKSKGLPCIPAPFGYKYNNEKNWVIDNKKAKIVLGVVQDYLSKRDYKATIKDYGISKGKYYRIIKNFKKGLYSRYIVFNKKDKETKYKGVHEPIISEELWRSVNE